VAVKERPVERIVGAAFWRTIPPTNGPNVKVEFEWAVIPALAGTAQEMDFLNAFSTEFGSSLAKFGPTEARTVRNLINTLRAHSALGTLTELKASGGTLGAISEAELVLLESKLGAMDQTGESEELIRVVDQIIDFNLASIGRLETEFKATDAMYSGTFEDAQANWDAAKTQEPATSHRTPTASRVNSTPGETRAPSLNAIRTTH